MKLRASFAGGVVTGFVITLMVGIIVAVLFMRSCASGSSQIRSQHASPDGKHIAVSYVQMGGGAAGWCEQYVDVTDSQSTFDMNISATGYKYEFSISCSSNVTVQWLSNDSLLILYSLGSGTHLQQKATSDDQAVRLIYRIQE